MTRTRSARIAGVAFLLYIVVGITQIMVASGTTDGKGTAAKLATIAAHTAQLRINLVLAVVISVIALTLAVALYRITREQDEDVALLALVCRVVEGGVTPVISILLTLALLWLATPAEANAPDAAATYPVAEFLMKVDGWIPLVAANFFAVGSTLFCWLLLRGRMIPGPLAWIGVAASVLLLIVLPLQLADVLRGLMTQLVWIPIALFEISLALWLLIKGIAPPAARAESREAKA
jgi:hypothetical protein